MSEITKALESGKRVAVALVLKAEGHTPQKAGVNAVIDAAGKICGTIGGGLVEAETQRHAVEACRSGQAAVFDFVFQGEGTADSTPICGGEMRILVDPTAAKDLAAYAAADRALALRQRGVLLTKVWTGPETRTSVEWLAEDAPAAETGFPGHDAVRTCLEREIVRLFAEEAAEVGVACEVLVEPVIPRPRLIILGGGHIGQALARQAVLVDFDVLVIDDRPEFTNPALYPEGVATQCADVARTIAACPVAGDTFIVIVTRGHRGDAEALGACIQAPAAYLGMIGSKRKVALLRKEFVEAGRATEEEWDRIHAPIGLEIGAVTVPEIATSILAQLIAVRRKGRAGAAARDMPRGAEAGA